MPSLYRVLFKPGEIVANLPLVSVDDDHGFDVAGNQEYLGPGCEGDFIEYADENGEHGDVWEFVVFSESEMERILDESEVVIVYTLVRYA